MRGGQRGYFSGLASYSNTFGNTSQIVTYLHRRADNLGPVQFSLNGLTAKLNIAVSDRQSLRLKLGFYDEISNATYLGLTQTMYDCGGQDYVQMAPDDRLPVRRYSASLGHTVRFADRLRLTTTAFGYTITRNWQRQGFSFSRTAANQTGVVWGNPAVPNGAVYMLNGNGQRNRQFQVAGLEPRLNLTSQLGTVSHELEVGARVLVERANEQFIIGKKTDARSGDQRDYEIQTSVGLSGFVQNKFQLTDNRYVASRRPEGIRVGTPRLLTAGVDVTF